MIHWLLATLQLSHFQADGNCACQLLAARIFQISSSKIWYTSIQMATLLKKDQFQRNGISVDSSSSGTFRRTHRHQIRYDVAPRYDAATPWLSGATTRSTVEPWYRGDLDENFGFFDGDFDQNFGVCLSHGRN